MRRLVATMLLVGATACVGDPKPDPCAERSCAEDAALTPDAQTPQDGGVDGGSDARVDAALDATPGLELDATRDLDTGVRDARTIRDATPSDARVLPLQGDLGVHDPTIIEADGTFTFFSTGPGIRVKRSDDLLSWTEDGRVFETNPAWIEDAVPGATDLWAPDIAYFAGAYHLYYSASTFGSRTSCIGHATATDLTSLDFVDHGPVVCTDEGDDYNAIDPAFVVDEGGTPWLTFGSFWSGIKLIRLAADGARVGDELYSLASRGVVEAVEAPYLLRREGYYYLFVSFDACCRGTASTYRIMVGRSQSVTGPYLDANGKAMSAGGGTMVVVGNQRWRGPGHNAVLTTGAQQYLVYHAYDANNGGSPTLRITELSWDGEGWPRPVGP
jgi:arabinan endo-1,5-alpha-L-arabinosidase